MGPSCYWSGDVRRYVHMNVYQWLPWLNFCYMYFQFQTVLSIAGLFIKTRRISYRGSAGTGFSFALIKTKLFLFLSGVTLFSPPGMYTPTFFVPGACRFFYFNLSACRYWTLLFRLCDNRLGLSATQGATAVALIAGQSAAGRIVRICNCGLTRSPADSSRPWAFSEIVMVTSICFCCVKQWTASVKWPCGHLLGVIRRSWDSARKSPPLNLIFSYLADPIPARGQLFRLLFRRIHQSVSSRCVTEIKLLGDSPPLLIANT